MTTRNEIADAVVEGGNLLLHASWLLEKKRLGIEDSQGFCEKHRPSNNYYKISELVREAVERLFIQIEQEYGK